MAIVNGTEYEFIDMQQASGGNTTRHMLRDAQARGDISSLKSAITESTENVFDLSVFDGVEGISRDENGYYTGTGQAFRNAFGFGLGVPGISFDANSQYYLSVEAYTDGNSSTSANNGLQFSFYASDAGSASDHIGRISFLNSTTTTIKKSLFSTNGKSVAYLSINASSSILNIWHIKNIMLCKSAVAVDYIPHTTAVDAIARRTISNAVYETSIASKRTNGGYINLQGKSIGDTVNLTPVSNNSLGYILDDCEAGDTFVITTSGLSAAKPYAFVSESEGVYTVTAIYDGDNNYSVSDFPVIAPTNGKLIVNSLLANSFSVTKVMNSRLVKKVDDAYFWNAVNASYRWKGKRVVAFGDSRTWYDKHSYTENTKPELQGTVCIGYQEQMRNLMMATVDNKGASGETSAQICTRIRAFDFTGYDAVLLEGGVNDFVKSSSVTIGQIEPIGSTFDTTTVYGAWQSAVEYILTNYPFCLIYMTIPPIAWIHQADDVFPYDVAKIKGEVAALYNIPCLDLYKNAGINIINRDHWYCDDVSATNWRLHFNDDGNALIGAKIAEFMIGN